MKIYHLRRSQTVKAELQTVFDFFKAPENLSKLTPRFLDLKILTPSPIRMEKGALIDYTVRVAGMRRRWTSIITEYDAPRRFVDEQSRGPYAFWHHTHIFEPSEGGTRITDEVRYAVPLGLIGQAANFIFVRNQLESIFRYRETVIRELFKS